MSASIAGSGGNSQVGRGTGLSTVDNVFGQGTFESTESNTDLAIEGDGLFVLREPSNTTSYYSRAGAFRFDGNGFLVNPEGFRVQGKSYDADGNLTAGDAADVQVNINSAIPANMTTNMTLTTNLNANSAEASGAFDIDDPTTYNYATSTTVYDSLGNTHMLTTYFSRGTAVAPADHTWEYNVVNEDNDIVATDTLNFDVNGEQHSDTGNITITGLNWNNGSAVQQIDLTLNTTQYADQSDVFSQDQDGYGPGSLMKISIDETGTVTANYSNGERIKVSQIVLAKFANFNGLVKQGQNLFSATDAAGPPRVGIPGPELGNLFTNALEQSTVDLAAEFVKMITTQRGFQANSRVITTTDEMLGELINLKR